MPFHVLFQAQAGTQADSLTFRKLAGKLPHMKESKVPVEIRTNSGEKGK